MALILAIDDEEEILLVIKRALEKAGHMVTTCKDPTRLCEQSFNRYDLILLDVMMPQIDGYTLCNQIRDSVDCPILFLTAKSMEEDIIKGLSIGGDDYIRKPFGIGELRARVETHLRREYREKKNTFAISGLRFNLKVKEVEKDDKILPLTRSEYEICEFLALHYGQVFSKEQIYEGVFGYDGTSYNSVIVEHIKNIRNKLSKVDVNSIETVWGIGYKWRK